MKHTTATSTLYGPIPHKVNEFGFHMPVKLETRIKLNGGKVIEMVKDRRTGEYLPVPVQSQNGYVYALPSGGDYS